MMKPQKYLRGVSPVKGFQILRSLSLNTILDYESCLLETKFKTIVSICFVYPCFAIKHATNRIRVE